jgi:hypothetical protein
MLHAYRKNKIGRQIDKMEREGLAYLLIDESTAIARLHCPSENDQVALIDSLARLVKSHREGSADLGFRLIPRSCAIWGEPGDNSTFFVVFTLEGSLPRIPQDFANLLTEYSDGRWMSALGAIVKDSSWDSSRNLTPSEQGGTGQPATRPVVEPEGDFKPQPEAEGRSR